MRANCQGRRSRGAFIAILVGSMLFAAAGSIAGEPDFVTKFNPKKGELPESVAVFKNKVVVGYAPRQLVVRVHADGSVQPYAQLPKAPRGKGFLPGMVFDPAGNLYANLISFVPEPKKGIYKVTPEGAVSLLVTDKRFGFLNGIIW